MRTRILGPTIVALLLAAAGTAAAQPQGDWYEQCYGPDGPTLEEMETTSCIKVEGGEWQPVRSTDPADPGGMFGTFLFFGILLSLVPAFAGMATASSANVSSVAGFFIGLVGSWVGVIGLYLYGHSQRRGTPVIQVGPAVEKPPPEPTTAAERLRTLQDLLDQGVITQEEYRARRQAAVESL